MLILSTVFPFQVATLTSGCEEPGCTKAQEKPAQFLNQFNEMNLADGANLADGDRKNRDAGSVMPFIGLTGSSKQSKTCCKNGGTCILGSFCACTQYFTGRSCEYDKRIRNCGIIPHGEWVQKGCSYCRCGYGVLHCFPHVFHDNCDGSEEVHWFHSSGVRIFQTKEFLCLALLLFLFFRGLWKDPWTVAMQDVMTFSCWCCVVVALEFNFPSSGRMKTLLFKGNTL